jgi:hypothetical protein
MIHRKQGFNLLIVVMFVFLVAQPSWTSFADTPTITLNAPSGYGSCSAVSDTLTTTGVPGNWTLRGWVEVQYVTLGGIELVPGGRYDIDQMGNLNLTISYPPSSEWPFTVPEWGLKEIHVNLAILVLDDMGLPVMTLGPGQDWDIWCFDTPPPPPPPPTHFCSPGYFRQEHHFDAWVPTGFSTGDDFDTTFGTDLFDPDITLLDAVWAKGGGENALARQGTAALLSAAHPDVNYPLSVAEVIAIVQAGNKGALDAYDDFGCPLD